VILLINEKKVTLTGKIVHRTCIHCLNFEIEFNQLLKMKLKKITDCIEEIAPLAFQEEYDNSGLLIGSPGMDVQKVLITVDVTEEIMDEAIAKSCNLVISHHPLIFKGLKRLTGAHFTERITMTAIKNGIAVYATHTNLDNASEGLNKTLITKMGVKNPSILSPVKGALGKLVTFCPVEFADKVRQSLFDAGAGRIGNYDLCSYNIRGQGTFRASDNTNPFVGEKNKIHFEDEVRIEVIFPTHLEKELIAALLAVHPYEEVAYDLYPLTNAFAKMGAGMIGELESEMDEKAFLQKIKELIHIPVVRHSALLNRGIKRVAVCGGSGVFLLPEAKKAGAHIFLTGDIKYHDFFEAQNEIILADIGHFESEQFSKDLIYSLLKEKFPTFAFLLAESDSNPVKYF
jgi:dinuclear metal center YbgI/SA1388 family protein